MQQDAEECWTQLLVCLRKLPQIKNSQSTASDCAIQQLFQGELVSEWVCKDSPEDKNVTTSSFEKLPCHIDDKSSYLSEGLTKSLEEEISKFSAILNREAVYTKKSKLKRLPYYLNIQFVRFFWKAAIGVKAKIVRPIEFPFQLDLYEYCCDELKATLDKKRKQIAPEEIKKINDNTIVVPPEKMINDTGMYELIAVLTHKGMRADSGHYVAYIRNGGQEEWLQYDDKVVTPCKFDDIRKLSGKGGGDWHMAYMCIYRSKQFDYPEDKVTTTTNTTTSTNNTTDKMDTL